MKKTHFMKLAVQDYRTSSVRMRSIMTADPELRLVYLELLFAMFEKGGSISADPEQLVEELGLPKATIEAKLPILEDFGRRTRRGGIQIVDGVIRNVRVSEDLDKDHAFRVVQADFGRIGGEKGGKGRPGIPFDDPEATPNDPQGNLEGMPNQPLPNPFPLPKESVEPNGSTLSLAEEFEQLWSAYGKKSDKAAAKKAFAAAKKKGMPPLGELLAKVQAWRASEQWTKNGGQYQPYLVSWLNKERWNDADPNPASANRRTLGSTPDRIEKFAKLGQRIKLGRGGS